MPTNDASPAHIVLVDDDPDVRALVCEFLQANGLRVTALANGSTLFDVLDREAVDLVLLDVRLPDADGLELASRLRQRAGLPIMLLTGQAAEGDRVAGLELGADDYVTKPFSPRELLARVRAVLRRYQVQSTLPERESARRAFSFDGWNLNLRTRRLVAPDGSRIELSNHEFSLLVALCRAPGVVLTRAQLLSMSRLFEAEVHERTIDVLIRRLRVKLNSAAGGGRLIVTERGAGYRFVGSVQTLY